MSDNDKNQVASGSDSENIPLHNMSSAPLTTEFGESNLYDEGTVRLSYSKPEYRDVVWAIIYYIHVAGVVGAGAYLWFTQYPEITSSDNDSNNNTDDVFADIELTGIFVAMGACMVTGLC